MADKIVDKLGANANILLQQIDQYPSLNEWWHNHVVSPVIKSFIPQCIALCIVLFCILYVHNWIAAMLCFVILVSKIYRMFISLSINLMHGYLTVQIRESYNRGVVDGQMTLLTEIIKENK